jgi:hypothetical protein
MIFLLIYDRHRSEIVRLIKFEDTDRATAEHSRLEAELEFHRLKLSREVVLLEARSEQALRRTHRRYFENGRQIVASADLKLKW